MQLCMARCCGTSVKLLLVSLLPASVTHLLDCVLACLITDKGVVAAVSMDLSKTFDMIPHDLLLAWLPSVLLQSACPSYTVTLETGPSVSG